MTIFMGVPPLGNNIFGSSRWLVLGTWQICDPLSVTPGHDLSCSHYDLARILSLTNRRKKLMLQFSILLNPESPTDVAKLPIHLSPKTALER